MNRARILALAFAAVLLLPILPITAGQTAGEPVPFRPAVTYTNVKSTTRMYLQNFTDAQIDVEQYRNLLWTYPPVKDDPTKTEVHPVQTATTSVIRAATFKMPDPLTHSISLTGRDAFHVNLWLSEPPGVDMVFDVRVVRVVGDAASGDIIANKTFDPSGADQNVKGALYLDKTNPGLTGGEVRYTWVSTASEKSRMQLEIYGQPKNPVQTGAPLVGSWTVHYGSESRPAYVQVVSEDAVKVAAWTEKGDRPGQVQTIYRKENSLTPKDWIKSFFLVKSAFGFQDFENRDPDTIPNTGQFDRFRKTTAPEMELFLDGKPTPLGDSAGGSSRTELQEDGENSVRAEGRKLYVLPSSLGHLVYTRKDPGNYEIRFTMPFRPDDAGAQSPSTLAAATRFAIADAGATLQPYPGSPLESVSHKVAAGRTTTFVLLAKNTGRIFDNLTLDLVPVPGPQPGWTAMLGGPALKGGNRVELKPIGSADGGDQGIITVTVQTPASAVPGTAATYQIRGSSQLDPNQKTDPIPLLVEVVTAEEAARISGVGVIVPAGDKKVRVGNTVTTPVYLWNRGAHPTGLTMGLEFAPSKGWTNQTLVFGGVPSKQVTVEEVPPGALVEVGLRVSAVPEFGADFRVPYPVTLNATYPGLRDPPTATVAFTAEQTSGFLVRLLNGVQGATTRNVEMNRTTNDPRDLSRNKDRDFLHGTWFRMWISNTGASPDTYQVTVPQFEETRTDENVTGTPGSTSLVQSRNRAWGEIAANPQDPCPGDNGRGCPPLLGFRDHDGRFTPANEVTVPPGQTAEMYVWARHQPLHDRFPLSDYRFNVQVESKTQQAGSIFVGGNARGWDACTADQAAVQGNAGGQVKCTSVGYEAAPLVEAVARNATSEDPLAYNTNHLVDVRLSERRSIQTLIAPHENKTFKFRVTNGASFGSFTTQNGIYVPSKVNITAKHDDEAGWRVKLRYVGQKGWNDSLELYNTPVDLTRPEEKKWENFDPTGEGVGDAKAVRQGFFDREVEMLIEPPSGKDGRRVFAGEAHVVTLEARTRHPVLGTQSDALTVTTIVAHKSEIKLALPLGDKVHPVAGREAYLGLFVLNDGSTPTNVSLRATVESSSPGWSVSPSDLSFVLTSHENRTLALRVRAPQNVPAGSTAEFKITATYRDRLDDLQSTPKTKTVTFSAEVIQNEAIDIEPFPAAINAEPRQQVNFTLNVRNTGQTRATYQVDTILVPNWTASLGAQCGPKALSCPVTLVDVPPNGGAAKASLVMRLPGDVVSGKSNEFVVRVREVDRDDDVVNEAYATVIVNVVGGQPIPSLQISKAEQIIERNGRVWFVIGVRNLGNVEGTFPISLLGPNDIGWRGYVTDENGRNISSIRIPANDRRTVNLTVYAPANAPERSVQEIELGVLTPDRTGGDRVIVRTVIHDYGLDVEALPARADMIPGLQATYNLRVHNLGNDNDTFELKLDMGALEDAWPEPEFGQVQLRVPPNEFRDVRLTVRSPKDNLPTPRTTQVWAYAASLGASNITKQSLDQIVAERQLADEQGTTPPSVPGITKVDSVQLALTVLDYRVGDVDQDGLLEVAVDANKRRSDGFELFREIYTTGTLSQAIESAPDAVTGHVRFLIDAPVGGSYDGIADVFWDPDAASVTRIQYAADVNFDSAPDYFLDSNADTVVDRVYDSGGRRYLTVEVKDILGRGEHRKQYLIYNDGDRFPDAFYDPEKNEVWRVVPAPNIGQHVAGFIPRDNTKPTLYYDIQAERVYQSPLVDSLEFFKEHWYAALVFALAAVVTAIAISKRKPVQQR